jgi:phosphoglycolate phosphatase
MKYKVAIFDMDGTILNTIEDLADTMNYCLKKYGMPERSLSEIKSFVGNGIRRLIDLAVPKDTLDKVSDDIYASFIQYYKDHCAIKTRPYDGITEVLQKLKENGVLTAVVSNKADYAVRMLCKDYFDGLFDYCIGDKEGTRRKPYPDSVISVMKHFNVSPDEVVYIGDSEVDYQTAVNAGIDLIMVSWGFREETYLQEIGADMIIRQPYEILKFMGIMGKEN